MNRPRRDGPTWNLPSMAATRAIYDIRNIFHTYLGIGCAFVSADNGHWMQLYPGWYRMRPHHFELYYDTNAPREQHNRRSFERAAQAHQPFLTRHGGFDDVVTPVRVGGRLGGTLFVGPFRTTPFTAAEIRSIWKGVSGGAPSESDPNFMMFTRMALMETPILDGATLEAVLKLVGQMMRLIAGEDPRMVAERIDALRPIIGRHRPHRYWVEWIIRRDRFAVSTERRDSLTWWEAEELGVTRFPTTVVAAMPVERGSRAGFLDSLITASALQKEAFDLARTVPETIGHALEDYGVLFMTSADPAKGATQARLEIRDRVRILTDTLSRRLKIRLAVGIGNPGTPGMPLVDSYHQAVSALHLCLQSGRSLLFYNEAPAHPEGGAMTLRRQAQVIAETYQRGSRSAFRLALERYLEQALLMSAGNLEVFRIHLTTALSDLLEAFRRRYQPENAAFDSMATTVERTMAYPEGVQGLLNAFRETAGMLASYDDRSSEVRAHLKMEQAQHFLDEHFAEPMVLKDVARRFGVSSSTFLRRFRKVTGRTFGDYLLSRRIDEARRLLSTTTMSMEQIAQNSGFNSASYFIQAFRRLQGTTPGKYRSRVKR